jgi:hypothetical protein
MKNGKHGEQTFELSETSSFIGHPGPDFVPESQPPTTYPSQEETFASDQQYPELRSEKAETESGRGQAEVSAA